MRFKLQFFYNLMSGNNFFKEEIGLFKDSSMVATVGTIE